MDDIPERAFIPDQPNPLRTDAPGSVTEMPSPAFIGHFHICTDVNYPAMVDF